MTFLNLRVGRVIRNEGFNMFVCLFFFLQKLYDFTVPVRDKLGIN